MSWSELYARIITATGWTFAQVDALFWWQVAMLFEGWQEFPPIGESFFAFLRGLAEK